MRRNVTALEVAYAAVTYAKAKGVEANERLFDIQSEAQMTLAAALYDAFPEVVFHRISTALQCPREASNRMNMAMRQRRKSGRNIDEAVIRKCRIAALELRVVDDPAPAPSLLAYEGARVEIVRTTAQPPDRRFPPQGQFRKPETDLDKEIYGTPLNRRLAHQFKGRVVENVTASLMGDPGAGR